MSMYRISDITEEHLGSDATHADVVAFRESVERYTCAEHRSEADAIDYLWSNGAYTNRIDGGHCGYCHRDCKDGITVPAVDADESWTTLAVDHEPFCWWIATRAHRVNLASNVQTAIAENVRNRRIHELRAAGLSHQQIADRLAEEGYGRLTRGRVAQVVAAHARSTA